MLAGRTGRSGLVNRPPLSDIPADLGVASNGNGGTQPATQQKPQKLSPSQRYLDGQVINPRHDFDLYKEIRMHPALTSIEKVTWEVLAEYARVEHDYVFPSYETIAEKIDTTKRWAIHIVKELLRKGFLKYKDNNENRTGKGVQKGGRPRKAGPDGHRTSLRGVVPSHKSNDLQFIYRSLSYVPPAKQKGERYFMVSGPKRVNDRSSLGVNDTSPFPAEKGERSFTSKGERSFTRTSVVEPLTVLRPEPLQVNPSSSGPPPEPADRNPPKREEEETIMECSVLLALNTYVTTGPDFAHRLCRAILAARPNLSQRQMVEVIHESVPRGYRVDGPGFFMCGSPDIARAPKFNAQASPMAPARAGTPPVSAEDLRDYLTSNAAQTRAAGFKEIAAILETLASEAEQYLMGGPESLQQCVTDVRAAGFEAFASVLETRALEAKQPLGGMDTLELCLTLLEEKLVATLTSRQTDEKRSYARRDLDEQLRPYRGKMSAEQLAMLERQYLERQLLERSNLPRLSLFYMR